jgi:hypothetical protein
VLAGFGTHWSTSLLPGHEELYPEAAGQEEGFQGEDELSLSKIVAAVGGSGGVRRRSILKQAAV